MSKVTTIMLGIASIVLGASWNIDGDMQHNCWYSAWIYVGETKQQQSDTSPHKQSENSEEPKSFWAQNLVPPFHFFFGTCSLTMGPFSKKDGQTGLQVS